MSLTLADARIVTPEGVHEGWLTIEDGRITRIYSIANPHKLRRLDEESDLVR